MQNNWNLVAANGRKVSDQTYQGTKEQVDAYVQMMYNEGTVKAIPAEVVDLNALTFEQTGENAFICKDREVNLFTFKPQGASVIISGEDDIEEARVGITSFLMFPKFAVQTAKAFNKI